MKKQKYWKIQKKLHKFASYLEANLTRIARIQIRALFIFKYTAQIMSFKFAFNKRRRIVQLKRTIECIMKLHDIIYNECKRFLRKKFINSYIQDKKLQSFIQRMYQITKWHQKIHSLIRGFYVYIRILTIRRNKQISLRSRFNNEHLMNKVLSSQQVIKRLRKEFWRMGIFLGNIDLYNQKEYFQLYMEKCLIEQQMVQAN
ncbi:unnamed protein product [Paramecium sonneborni]|uniref:Uncharacterized protein n=1 Tax=Paramecium sonneborni TaxID=65129 RepID=A0A8S1KD48_9CILI|nr:unnamed protein product [Paramecium sonneborni]